MVLYLIINMRPLQGILEYSLWQIDKEDKIFLDNKPSSPNLTKYPLGFLPRGYL